MKLLKWIPDNILFIITLFLLAFIPLYPKLPIIDITHTWVYIRAEDFFVAFALVVWIVLLFAKKITFKTPLTMPIMLFWIVGALSTLHGILLIFPTLDNTFPNVALLSYLRRIEYVGMFFIGYAAIRKKNYISYVIVVLAITLLLISLYGIGQKYLGFPAFLTMNEEFAKGIPIRLSALSRVSSTFGGHYDLAAYLVLIIPILTSLIFGFKNWLLKFSLVLPILLGFVVLFMTVSRSSFFVLLVSLALVLFFQKKKLAIISIVVLSLLGLVFLSSSTSLLQRFENTVKEVNVLVDTKTGEPIGHIKEVPSSYFKDKTIRLKYAEDRREAQEAMANKKREDAALASDSGMLILSSNFPPFVPVIEEPNAPNGENLPQGTGYINLTLAPIEERIGQFLYQDTDVNGKISQKVLAIRGEFLIKKVLAYDLSFTTRFQGGWPRAMSIFRKDILFGGGYSATGLAVDNNYFRILGEVGLLGFFAYFGILLLAVIYIKKVLPEVDSPVVKSFVLGFVAGIVGLLLNAVLIDVFEASKIAFTLWLLVGITVGTLSLYQKKSIDIYLDFKKTLTSTYAVIIYLSITVIIIFSSMTKNYFVGDDFTWLRWIADCSKDCTTFDYFTRADGFFYRPGAKIYYLLMYNQFWLNQTLYHAVSIGLHFMVAVLVFLIAKRVLKNFLLSALSAFLFLILSGFSEAVFWISSTGFLFNAVFVLLSLLFFIFWEEKKKKVFLIISLICVALGLMFHEVGVIAPLLLILYGQVFGKGTSFRELLKRHDYKILFSPLVVYFILRYLAHSHWFNGDYSYNLLKMPFNFIGNTIGYLALSLLGPQSLPLYQVIRGVSKGNIIIVLLISIVLAIIAYKIFKIIFRKIDKEEQKILIFGSLFFVIALLPFLGLGNISSRYSYLAGVGFIILFVYFLKKIYDYLIVNGQQIAISSVILVVAIFSLLHIIELQKINNDWNGAGEKSNKFLISLNNLYRESWTKSNMKFYFINVPIKNGDAWVFPVGLSDAVWFVFKNENIKVYQPASLEEALNAAKDIKSEKVFEFTDDGGVKQREETLGVSDGPI